MSRGRPTGARAPLGARALLACLLGAGFVLAGCSGGVKVRVFPAAAVRDLLDARSRAILTGQASAFALTADAGLRDAQRAWFARLSGVPLSSWQSRVVTWTAEGPSGWSAVVLTRFALTGFDSPPAATADRMSFVVRSGRWLVGGVAPYGSATVQEGGAAARVSRPVWDFGPVEVVTTGPVLVLGHPGSAVALRDIAQDAVRAVARVRRAWGDTGWAGRVVLEVPASPQEETGIAGRPDLASYVAVTIAAGASGATGRAVPLRVVVDDDGFARLSPAGRVVVLAHEITHVATWRVSGDGMPAWLVEGFADSVAYSGSGLGVAQATRELSLAARQFGSARAADDLPGDDAFSPGRDDAPVAYEQAWLACRYLVERWGWSALVGVFRDVGEGRSVADTFTTRLGVTVPDFIAGWRGYVGQVLREDG